MLAPAVKIYARMCHLKYFNCNEAIFRSCSKASVFAKVLFLYRLNHVSVEPISLSQAMRQGLKNPPFLGGKIIVFGDYFY
jgi:hypothetical protein